MATASSTRASKRREEESKRPHDSADTERPWPHALTRSRVCRFEAMFRNAGSGADAHKLFALIDKDGDGNLTEEELKQVSAH